MSESAKARCTLEWRKRKSESYQTKLVENEVRELYESGMTQTEVAESLGVTQRIIYNFMRRFSIPARKAVKRNQQKEANGSWKGNSATYSAFHVRVIAIRGKPSFCTSCSKTTGRFEWANLTGRYEDINDYIRLCVSCHKRFDIKRRKETGKPTSKHVPRRRLEVK